jgi:hypothetical protein
MPDTEEVTRSVYLSEDMDQLKAEALPGICASGVGPTTRCA